MDVSSFHLEGEISNSPPVNSKVPQTRSGPCAEESAVANHSDPPPTPSMHPYRGRLNVLRPSATSANEQAHSSPLIAMPNGKCVYAPTATPMHEHTHSITPHTASNEESECPPGSLGSYKGSDPPTTEAARENAKSAPSAQDIQPDKDDIACDRCQATKDGRKLVVCLDGTKNQFGLKNTNVVQIYARIEKNDKQLTYYNSGIGTYANPSRHFSWALIKTWYSSTIDLAIAWDFQKIILAAYRWLSEHYRPGDQIFLFGFSRGAYQARVLAGMIETIGLIFPGNEEQIPFAYELYANEPEETTIAQDKSLAGRFKRTFSRPDVHVHFIGAWDTVSHVCYFRHALALDERRVKFPPEDVMRLPREVYLGTSIEEPFSRNKAQTPRGPATKSDIDGHFVPDNNSEDGDGERTLERVKEVWFAGCHSDVGGGNEQDDKLLMDGISALWMANEARLAGLVFAPSAFKAEPNQFKTQQVTESLDWRWWILELLPGMSSESDLAIRRHRWWPHLGHHRYIRPDQKIHVSVALMSDYVPRAQFLSSADSTRSWSWDHLLGKNFDNDQWELTRMSDILELDLHDISSAKRDVQQLKAKDGREEALIRLLGLSLHESGTWAIADADENIGSTLFSLVTGDGMSDNVKHNVRTLLERMACHADGVTVLHKSETLIKFLKARAKKAVSKMRSQRGDEESISLELEELQIFLKLHPRSYPFIKFVDVDADTVQIIKDSMRTPLSDLAASAIISMVQRDGMYAQEAFTYLCEYFSTVGVKDQHRMLAIPGLSSFIKGFGYRLSNESDLKLENVVQTLYTMLDHPLQKSALRSAMARLPQYLEQWRIASVTRRSGLTKFKALFSTQSSGAMNPELLSLSAEVIKEVCRLADKYGNHILEAILRKPTKEIEVLNPDNLREEFVTWLHRLIEDETSRMRSSILLAISNIVQVITPRETSPSYTIDDASTGKSLTTEQLTALATKIIETYHDLHGDHTALEASQVLYNIAPSFRKSLPSSPENSKLADLLHRLLEKNDRHVQSYALCATVQLVKLESLRRRLLELGFLDVIIEQIQMNDGFSEVIYGNLDGLADYEDVRQQFIARGILKKIGQHMVQCSARSRFIYAQELIWMFKSDYDRYQNDHSCVDDPRHGIKSIPGHSRDGDNTSCEDSLHHYILRDSNLVEIMRTILEGKNEDSDDLVWVLSWTELLRIRPFRSKFIHGGCLPPLIQFVTNSQEASNVRARAMACLEDCVTFDADGSEPENIYSSVVGALIELMNDNERFAHTMAVVAFRRLLSFGYVRSQVLQEGRIEQLITMLENKRKTIDDSINALHDLRIYDEGRAVLKRHRISKTDESSGMGQQGLSH